MAVVNAVKKLRVYLLNKPFKIKTDCKAFTQRMNKKDLPSKVARWAMMLQDFTYEVEHRPGNRMKHVGVLSRNPAVYTITAQIRRAQEMDEETQKTRLAAEEKPLQEYGRELIVLPDGLAETTIRKCHEENKHFGSGKMEQLLQQQYDIKNLGEKIKKCINNCVVCLISDRKRGKKEGLLHPIPKDYRPLQTLHIDHLGPMTATDKQYKYILAIIDGFTKFCWLYPTKTKLELLQSTFGNPRCIISDRGGAKFCEQNDIQHTVTTTGIPRGNGQVERLNSIIISVLTKLCQQEQKNWYRHLPAVQKIINSTHQRAIKATPFEVLTGVKMRTKSDQQIVEMLNDENMEEFTDDREQIREIAKQEIQKIQRENQAQHNKKAKIPAQYGIGELVLIKLTQFGSAMKLKPHFLGPYKIIKIKRNDRYDVEKVSSTEGSTFTSTSADNMKAYRTE